jgi:hypothetical protein
MTTGRVHFMRWIAIFSLLLFAPRFAAEHTAEFADKQCITVDVSKGEIGEGKLRYCDDGIEQELYVSGELDFRPTDRSEKNAVDLVAIKKVLSKFKKRETGVFRVVTNNAGGGETGWHYKLIMAVEDACTRDCRIITEINGRCESACNQLHITCVRHARTIVHKGASTCEHATTDEDNPKCNKRDPLVRGERDLCDTQVAVKEYKDRCGRLTRGRDLDIDEERKKEIYAFLDGLASRGIFDTTRLTCTRLTWAETESNDACGINIR